jgi:hypothetical protein
MQTPLARLFCILPWAILLALAVGVAILAIRLKSAAKSARASAPPSEEKSNQAMYLNGTWDINLHWDVALVRRKNFRLGLPEIHWEKHIRWTLIWWP